MQSYSCALGNLAVSEGIPVDEHEENADDTRTSAREEQIFDEEIDVNVERSAAGAAIQLVQNRFTRQ